MNPYAISLLLVTALAAFVALAWRKLAILPHLQPENRFDDPARRMTRVLVDGFLQSKMIRGERKPGIMHTVIFLGFLVLLVRKVQLLVIGFDQTFVYPGLLGGLFAALKDGVELAVLAAVVYAFYRRFVLRPRRLEPNREAVLILSLIAAIMLTDFLFDGFRFALLAGSDGGIAHERSFAFVGAAVGSALAGLDEGTLGLGYHLFYWLQMATVLSFLVLLPVGEHFHIVTALPTLYFGRRAPLNRVPSVDLEKLLGDGGGDEEMKVGVRTAKDLVWKDGLDAFTCTECGRCKDACPTFLTGKPLSLKAVNDSLKAHLFANRHAIAGAEPALPALVGQVIAEDTLWACTTCGYCEAACPIGLEHLGKFFRMRQHQVLMEGTFPHELKGVFDAYEVQSNPWALPADTRGDWAKALGVPVVERPEQVRDLDYLFYVGSAQSFDPRGQKIARAFVDVLRAAGVRFAILGPRETSTGECVRRAGNEMLFQTLARQLVETLNALGATRIVTCDPHAFNSLGNEYPEFGGRYEVVHHTQLIAQLVADGRLRLAREHERVMLHDPCYLGRHNGEYEAPRSVLASVTRDRPLEFPLARERAMCCGAGGARMWMEESLGTRINVTRVEQALEQSPRVIATACPYCTVMLSDGLKAVGRDAEVVVRDVAELVAAALVAVPRPGEPVAANG